MTPAQWDIFKRAARREKLDEIPMAMIVDSPWFPGYLGIAHLDYYLDPNLWFVISRDADPLATLLLSRSHGDALELVYLGVAPAARGSGAVSETRPPRRRCSARGVSARRS